MLAVVLGIAWNAPFVPIVEAQEIERPQAVDLLPERTALYVNVNNIRDLVTDLQESNFGRMLQDERIAPLVQELYGEAKDSLDNFMENEDVGFSMSDFMSLPAGEICFAIVTPRRKEPKFVLIMDVPEDSDIAERLIDRGRTLAEDDGADFTDGNVADLKYQTVRESGGDTEITYVLHEGTFVASNSEEVFGEVITRWLGEPEEKDRTLAGNRKFVTIMNKCKSTEELPMAISFFCDPIMLARSITANDAGARVVFAFLPTLGLDGFSAFGGAALFNEKNYESVLHGHILLTNPRAGIIEMIALRPGFYEPEPFVSDNIVSYTTSSWDFRKFVAELEKIVDTFTSEGTFQQQIDENINEELEINFQEDVLENLAGRLSLVQWTSDVPALDGTCTGLVVQVRDEDRAEEFLKAIMDRVNDFGSNENLIESDYKGVTYWHVAESFEEMGRNARRRFRDRRREAGEDDFDSDDDRAQLELLETQPTFALIDDNFVLTGNIKFMEHLIETQDGDHDLLADDPDFKSTMKEIRTLMDGNLPSLFSYSRPAESMRMLFEVARSDNTKDFLYDRAEDNRFVEILSDMLEDDKLPPFDDLAAYFPPQGAFVVNDETGFHFLAFQRKANVEDED